jgi:transposase InsO family protein
VQTASLFLQEVIVAYPHKIDKIRTDNGRQFSAQKQVDGMPTFAAICKAHHIDHLFTKLYHPWTNGQVERMNRTLKEATTKKYYYKNHEILKKHLNDFVIAYNYAQPLRTLKGLCPFEEILRYSQLKPEKYKISPSHLSLKPYK